jgi:hypothetical protein
MRAAGGWRAGRKVGQDQPRLGALGSEEPGLAWLRNIQRASWGEEETEGGSLCSSCV